jgi:hypothetical protein
MVVRGDGVVKGEKISSGMLSAYPVDTHNL